MGWTNQSANPNSCCCPEDLFPVPAACSLQPHLVSPQFRRLSQLPLGSLPCSSLIPLEVASVSFSCFSWRSTKILKHVIAGSRFTVTCHLMIHFYMIMWVFHCQLRLLEGKIVFFFVVESSNYIPMDGNRNLALFPGQLIGASICGSRRGAWPWALPLPWWSETRFGSGGSWWPWLQIQFILVPIIKPVVFHCNCLAIQWLFHGDIMITNNIWVSLRMGYMPSNSIK